MGSYYFEVCPQVLDKERVQAWIDEFVANDGAKAFLQKSGPDEPICVTDDPNALNAANQGLLTLEKNAEHGRVTVSSLRKTKNGNSEYSSLKNETIANNAFAEGTTGGKKLIWINPVHPNHKPILNVLIHETDHFRFTGYGARDPHDDIFYKFLAEDLRSFGITPDPKVDLWGKTEEYLRQIPSPAHVSAPPTNAPKPKSQQVKNKVPLPPPRPKTLGEYEGLRYLHTPKVVSINPSVNLTPMGGAVVPVPYTVVGYFDESVNTTRSVRFTSDQVFTMTSFVREVHGDAPGSAGGIKSGTVSATAEPIEHSVNVRAERFHIVRHDDLFYMNNRNTIGRAIFIVSSGDQGNTA